MAPLWSELHWKGLQFKNIIWFLGGISFTFRSQLFSGGSRLIRTWISQILVHSKYSCTVSPVEYILHVKFKILLIRIFPLGTSHLFQGNWLGNWRCFGGWNWEIGVGPHKNFRQVLQALRCLKSCLDLRLICSWNLIFTIFGHRPASTSLGWEQLNLEMFELRFRKRCWEIISVGAPSLRDNSGCLGSTAFLAIGRVGRIHSSEFRLHRHGKETHWMAFESKTLLYLFAVSVAKDGDANTMAPKHKIQWIHVLKSRTSWGNSWLLPRP